MDFAMTRTTSLLAVRHLTVSIQRPPDEVYAFVASPENLPHWATGLGEVRREGGEFFATVPEVGDVKLIFAERNAFGVADHDVVVLRSGERIHNPIRVIPNGSGSEVTFTLLRQPNVSDEKFATDAAWVEKDLNLLKAILEGQR
jgi:uncharacterized protein YndB with AHSA1/START domain